MGKRIISMRAFLEYKGLLNEWMAWRDAKRKEYQMHHVASHIEVIRKYRREYKRKQRAFKNK